MLEVNELKGTEYFTKWLEALKDIKGKARLVARIRRAENGNFGDCGPVGEGVFEMRVHCGPGYRIYYSQRGRQLYWLLIGGNKRTQADDVERAKEIKREIERNGL